MWHQNFDIKLCHIGIIVPKAGWQSTRLKLCYHIVSMYTYYYNKCVVEFLIKKTVNQVTDNCRTEHRSLSLGGVTCTVNSISTRLLNLCY